MTSHESPIHHADQLHAHYASQPGAPSAAQWQAVLQRPADAPVTRVNCFAFRDRARYDPEARPQGPAPTGAEAFERYAAVSTRVAARLGVQFIHMGAFVGTLFGEPEHWDLVVVGRYPNLRAFVGLYLHPDYLGVVAHRTAACERQRVIVSASGIA